jgi:hypothetical protein
MKIWLSFYISILASSSTVYACECVGYANDTEMVSDEIRLLPYEAAGIDGRVIKSTSGFFGNEIALIKPTRMWFGERRVVYRVKYTSMCDHRFHANEKVRVALVKIEDKSFFAHVMSIFRGGAPLYKVSGCSNFRSAMEYPAMHRALKKLHQKR